ncbi:AAA family ATPase [Candidatus Woesearchaeota archaeon]|nr:AAA family ATPase [Candidatus Woesearchaeota archaeon]
MKVIAVTGVPGTGKTALSKRLAKELGFYYFDVNEFIDKNKLYGAFDKKRKTKIVDIKKLNKKLIEVIDFLKNYKNIENAPMSKARSTKTITKEYIIKNIYNKSNKKIKGIIIDSHLSHYLPRRYIDLCIVTKCSIEILNKRLKKKKFHKNKIKENLQAEIFDICYTEAVARKHKVIVAYTTKGFNTGRIAKQLGG